MTRHPLKGTIGQISYFENEQIRLPNDNIDLNDFSEKRIVEFSCITKTYETANILCQVKMKENTVIIYRKFFYQ